MKLIILVCLCSMLLAYRDQPYRPIASGTPEEMHLYTQKQLWLDQVLDHYNYKTTELWKQRYWVIDTFFNPRVGPVFLFICGQYTC